MPWWQAEPDRRERDRQEIAIRFPGLAWCEPARAVRGAGGWCGRLPLWPYNRPAPPGLVNLGRGLDLELVYPQAYPVLPPSIFPLDPAPELVHFTHHRWHLNGDGSLCLLDHPAAWSGRDSIIDLLLKAAGWRVEFALLDAGLIDTMTDTGIVSTGDHDALVAQLPPLDRERPDVEASGPDGSLC